MDAAVLSLVAAPLAAGGVSLGDLPAWFMFSLALIGQAVTWLVMIRGGNLRATRHTAHEATAAALQARAIETLTKELGRIASGLETHSKDFQQHRLEDTDYHARTDELMKSLAETQGVMARALENQQRQITEVAIAPARQRARG